MHIGIAKKLEAIHSKFFWGATSSEKKMVWIKWDQVLAKRERGGLDIGSLVSFNLALILNWKYRVFRYPNLLWVRLLKTGYGANGGFYGRSRAAIGTSPWSRVLAAANKLEVAGVLMKDTLYKQVGNDRDTIFWDDCWVGDCPLAVRFPRLAALEAHRDCTVAEKWSDQGWCWTWQRRMVGGRTLSSLDELNRVLGDFRCSEEGDVWRWKLSDNGEFSVADTRRWIDDIVLPTGAKCTRWCAYVPRKVNIFIWRMRLHRLPIRVTLSEKGMEINSILCAVCGMSSETMSHLFCHCEVTLQVWAAMFRHGGRV
ncbi:hypothetical protein LXL04_035631 [Taraxacum kok-saghyz]